MILDHPSDSGYAVSPDHTFALWRFGLISDEQAQAMYEQYAREDQLFRDLFQQSGEEWKKKSWRERLRPSFAWRLDWTAEHMEPKP